MAYQLTPVVQRQPEDEQEEEEPATIQEKRQDSTLVQRREAASYFQTKRASGEPVPVSAKLGSGIQALRDGGQSLPESTRSFFAPRFGYDFTHVRVHTDSRAAEMAGAINARAFTVGRDVVFGPGQYAPTTLSGQRLLAHELSHVIQQGPQRTPQVIMRQRAETEPVDECSVVPAGTWVKKVEVDQETPQSVTVHWKRGTEEWEESDACSTGKGHCCLGPEAASGEACSESGSRRGGSNCTPVGERTVNARSRITPGNVEFWTEFVPSPRSIALHDYDPLVDGTPRSHGCVRLHRDTAIKIWCGARVGQTRVNVKGLARPTCEHDPLVWEWINDFQTAGMTPPDGESFDARTQRHIDITRRELRSALGVSETKLTERIAELEEATGGFAQETTGERETTYGTMREAIPRCVPTLTTEEARLETPAEDGGEPVPARLLAASGLGSAAASFVLALKRASTLAEAKQVVRRHGSKLWKAAVERAQKGDTDDRPLYWARLQMTRALRETELGWLTAMNPDEVRRTREDLLSRLERASRGMETVTFERGADSKRILISGFDPFNLGDEGDIRRGNPSGAAVLALDGLPVNGPDGISGRIEGVIFPVRFPDFNAGIVETFFRPYLEGATPVSMIMTISQGVSSSFEVEQYAGRRRSAGGVPGNLGETGGGTLESPVEPPGLAPGPEFLETSLPGGAIRSALGRTIPLTDETEITEIPAGSKEPIQRPAGGPTPGSIAVKGSGGGYLSNEIFYRTLLLRSATGATIPAGHLHTSYLAPPEGTGITSPEFETARNTIVDTIKSIIEASLPSL